MRVFVTGIGVVSPLGIGRELTWRRLLAGDSAIGRLRLFDLAGCRVDVAAQVPDLRVQDVAPAGQLSGFSRTDAMAVLAAREALAHAALAHVADVHLVVGGTTAGMFESEPLLAQLTRDPGADVELERLRSHPLSAPADRVHEVLGPFARVRTVCSACSGGALALLLGGATIRAGAAARVLAGGVDGLCRLTYSGFAALGALDPAPCRPFDRSRAGLSLGEGAAFVLLESETAARARGAEPLAELGGWAVAAEAHHPTQPEPEGQVATWVMQRALARAGVAPDRLDYVNAHGTGTLHNDAMEAAALGRLLGAAVDRVAVSSIKGHIGHALGAAGALEAAVSALVVARGWLPATVGLRDVDPACAELAHVRRAEPRSVAVALSNSFGFGGTDAALVLTRPGAFEPPRGAQPPGASSGRSVVITGGASAGSHGVEGLSAWIRPSAAPSASVDDGPHGPLDSAALGLDPARARRFDRPARFATAAAQRALAQAGLSRPAGAAAEGRFEVGIVVGSGFGSVGSTGSYLTRLIDRGARFASPALFPGALPSALAVAPSLYLALQGPVMSTADLAASGEAAVALGASLCRFGEADAVVVAGVEEQSEVAARVSGPLCSGLPAGSWRGEGAAALVLEDSLAAERRGAAVRARLTYAADWRGAPADGLGALPAPQGRAAVFRAHAALGPPVPVTWSTCPLWVAARWAGAHESAGTHALLAAVAALDAGEIDEALVVGGAPDRAYAFVLAAPPRPAGPVPAHDGADRAGRP